MGNKFDFEEADAAIQVAEAKDKYEQEIRDYTKATEDAENAKQKMMDCKDELDNFANTMHPVIKDLNDACTIKLPEEVKKEYNAMFDNACDRMVKRIEEAGRKAEKRIKDRKDRKTVSEPLFYCMWWIIVMLSLFFGCVWYANYEFLHLEMIWKIITYIGVLSALGVALMIYYFNKTDKYR